MLEMPSTEVIVLKPVKEEVVRSQPHFNTYYIIGPEEVMCLDADRRAITFTENFKVHGGQFWAHSNAVRRFVRDLKALGIEPEMDVEIDYGQSYFFGFWFDVSTPDTAAYYWIGTRAREEVLPVICTEHLTNAVVTNVKAVDEMFHKMITTCQMRARRV